MRILDTDFLIDYLHGTQDAVDFFDQHRHDVATTTINAAELWSGLAVAERPQTGEAIERLLANLPTLPFGPRAAKRFGPLKAARRKGGLPGGPFDLLIASIAAAEGATVVTRNLKDFQGHEGVKAESY